MRAGRHAPRRREARQAAFLGQLDVADERAAGAKLRPREGAEAVERGDAEARLEAPLAGEQIEVVVGQGRQALAPFRPQRGHARVLEQALGRQQLAGRDPRQLRGERAVRDRAGQEVAGRHVQPGERQRILALGERGEEVVRPGIEQAVLGEGARRHHAHHGALDQRLAAPAPGRGRVLGLLADRDLETLLDQALQVSLGAVHRHAAHRDVGLAVAATPGERDVQRRGRELGVLEEQLVEIAQAEEQQAVGVLRLDRLVLGDHRRRRFSIRTGAVRLHLDPAGWRRHRRGEGSRGTARFRANVARNDTSMARRRKV